MTTIRKTVRLLIVDDDRGDLALFKAYLKDFNENDYKLFEAVDLDEAKKIITEQDLDLIVTDLQMSDSRGLETFAKIQNMTLDIPIIVLSGLNDSAVAIEAVGKGAQDYLVKGQFDPGLLHRVIQYALQRYSLLKYIEEFRDANLQTIIEKNSDGVLLINEQGTIRLANPAAEILMGFEPGQLIGQKFRHPIYAGHQLDIAIQTRPGEAHSVELKAVEMRWKNEDVFLITLHDITKRKQLETAKYEFLSLVAHELRTPLIGIGGTIRNVLMDQTGDIKASVKDYLMMASEEVDRLDQMVTEFLDYSAIEEQRLMVNRTKVNIKQLIEKVLINFAAGLKAKKLNLSTDIRDNMPAFLLDENRCYNVFRNLIENAIKYTPENGWIKVSAGYDQQTMVLELTVEDSGIGIAEKNLDQLFQRFIQIERKVQNARGGIGLGLSIVKGIVEAHGGQIRVESHPGQGSRFIITIPQQFENSALKEHAPMKHLLVVDDSRVLLRILRDRFQALGFTVDQAAGFEECLNLVATKPIDIILLDFNLPGMNGDRLTTLLRKEKNFKGIIIIYTASNPLFNLEQAHECGADDFVIKTPNLNRIVEIVSEFTH